MGTVSGHPTQYITPYLTYLKNTFKSHNLESFEGIVIKPTFSCTSSPASS